MSRFERIAEALEKIASELGEIRDIENQALDFVRGPGKMKLEFDTPTENSKET